MQLNEYYSSSSVCLDGMKEDYGDSWGVIQEAGPSELDEALYAVYVKQNSVERDERTFSPPLQKTFTDPRYPQRKLTVIQGEKEDA